LANELHGGTGRSETVADDDLDDDDEWSGLAGSTRDADRD
jgi:hypothetical protein